VRWGINKPGCERGVNSSRPEQHRATLRLGQDVPDRRTHVVRPVPELGMAASREPGRVLEMD